MGKWSYIEVGLFISYTEIDETMNAISYTRKSIYYEHKPFISSPSFFPLVGDMDGIYKGKKYFTAPDKSSKMVKIHKVKAVLHAKVSHDLHLLYRPRDLNVF